MELHTALKNLGLNDKEASVYLALLHIGRGSAYSVAKRAGLKKPTTYVVLDELTHRGLVEKVPRAKKQLFMALAPDQLLERAEEKVRYARRALPELEALHANNSHSFRTAYYEGETGIKQMAERMNENMAGQEILGMYARVSKEGEVLEPLFHEIQEQRNELNISTRGMTPDDASLAWYRKRLGYLNVNMKFLDPKDYNSESSIEVGDTFVQITSARHQQGLHIDNPDIAKQMRQLFEMLWECRPEQASKEKRG